MEGNPEKLYKKGKEAVTTGFTRWSKDYVSAAIYFDQASSLFKVQGKYDDVDSVGDQSVRGFDSSQHET